METTLLVAEVYKFQHEDDLSSLGFRVKNARGQVVDACSGYLTEDAVLKSLVTAIERIIN